MATITEMKCALRETLEARGVLGQLQAHIRAEVFSALEDQREPRPQLTNENLLINELIREYLEFNRPLLYGLVSHFLNNRGNRAKVFLQGAAVGHRAGAPDA